MRKRKQILAAILAVTMVLGGSLTAGATESEGEVFTLSEADEDAKLNPVEAEEADISPAEITESEEVVDAEDKVLSENSELTEEAVESEEDEDMDEEENGEKEEEEEEEEKKEEEEEEVEEEEEEEEEEDYGIMTMSYTPYHLDYDYGTLNFDKSSDGYSASAILSKAVEYIVANEGNYTTVLKSDVGKGTSIGKIGWHAENALLLLRLIITEGGEDAYNILSDDGKDDTFYNEITDANTDWSDYRSEGYRILTDSEAERVETLLGTTYGKSVQDKLAESYVKSYLNDGYDLGLRKGAVLVDYADMENQYGYYQTTVNGIPVGGAQLCAIYAINLAGSAANVTLNDLHIAGVIYIATNDIYTERGDYYLNAYIERRRLVYGKLVSSGWSYGNSGDYVIPYSSSGTEGAAWLKTALNYFMGAGLTVNNSYDDALTSAVKTYQKYAGLTQSGVADLHTTTKLIYDMYYISVTTGAAPARAQITDIVKINGKWVYTVNGDPDYSYTGVANNSNGWWYVENGVVDFTYNGFAHNSNGWWYCENGEVKFDKNGVFQDTKKKIDGTSGWWYVKESKVQTSYTGVADYSNENGWWYVKNGKVDFTANTVAKNKNGWWYVEGGKVIFSYNGFADNSNGWWYIEDGKVTFSKNSVIKDSGKKIDGTDGWWYVKESKVQTSYTGVADYSNSNGWWYVKNGKVDFTANTVAKNKNGWWYVLDGKVQFGFTGLADYSNSNGWWYIKDGKVDFTHNGVEKNKKGWWYVKNGKVIFSFNGIAQNSSGWWYIKDGKVDFTFTGTVTENDVTYSVVNGRVDR